MNDLHIRRIKYHIKNETSQRITRPRPHIRFTRNYLIMVRLVLVNSGFMYSRNVTELFMIFGLQVNWGLLNLTCSVPDFSLHRHPQFDHLNYLHIISVHVIECIPNKFIWQCLRCGWLLNVNTGLLNIIFPLKVFGWCNL